MEFLKHFPKKKNLLSKKGFSSIRNWITRISFLTPNWYQKKFFLERCLLLRRNNEPTPTTSTWPTPSTTTHTTFLWGTSSTCAQPSSVLSWPSPGEEEAAYFSVTNLFMLFIFTVWKFRDFSATQILREINFGVCRSSTTAIVAFIEYMNFEFAISKDDFTKVEIERL